MSKSLCILFFAGWSAAVAAVYIRRGGASELAATNDASADLNLEPGIPKYIHWESKP